jgi:ATP-dependent Clp protease protease subunit
LGFRGFGSTQQEEQKEVGSEDTNYRGEHEMAMSLTAAQGVATAAASSGPGLSFEKRNAVPRRSCALGEMTRTIVSVDGFFGDTQFLEARGGGGRYRTKVRVSGKTERVNGVRAQNSSSFSSFDHIPKHFRGDHLKELGLNENFKNVPRHLYGLNPAQMDMFMNEDSPMKRQAERVTENSISSAQNYKEGTGLWSLTGLENAPSRLSMSVSMYRGGGGYGRPKTAPPDLPSLLLDSRICYLGMPIVPAVTELIIAELLWLDYDNPGKPIYFYINSPGTQNDKRESIGFETEAYAIADTIAYVKPKVFTVNCGMAFGQAAMLLSIGDKGYRAVQPNSVTKLYSPKVNQSSGAAIDMWIKAKELDANTDYYIDLLTKGTGKPREEIAYDIQRPKYFRAQEAIDYGLADKIIESRGVAMERRNYDEMLAQSKAARQQYARPGSQSAPAGGR